MVLLHSKIKSLSLLWVLAMVALPLGAQAEDTLIGLSPVVETPNVAMLGWANSMGIVEQLQAIHRMSQSSSPQALQSLLNALNSPFQLARRKASSSLLEKSHQISAEDKQFLANILKTDLKDADPVVQKNLIRTVADLDIPESREALKAFFASATVKQQRDAVEALSVEGHASGLSLARQYSTFPEIRQAASGTDK